MSRKTSNEGQNSTDDDHADDTVSTLMNLAGPRSVIRADIEKRVHDNVRQRWQSETRGRSKLRWAVPAALAATILIVFAFNMQNSAVPLQQIGTIANVYGDSQASNQDFTIGRTLYAGETLETGAQIGISISLAEDISLRIDANTSLQFDAADEITLVSGRVYADSGERIYRDRQLTINTEFGTATDIGTQFSVSVGDSELRVAVREGRVDVIQGQSTIVANAGEKLLVQNGNDVIVESVTPYDDSWQWATMLAPEYDNASQSLLEFLKWAARETGRTLVFSSDEVRMATMRSEWFGSIKGFTPDEALASILATTQFAYVVDEKSITIDR